MKLIKLEILKKVNAQKYIFNLIYGFVLFVFVVVIERSRMKLRWFLSLSFSTYESYLIFHIKNRCGNTSYHKICPWEKSFTFQNKV